MTAKLHWRQISDLTFTASVDGTDLYAITRSLSYENYPAQDWEYVPTCIADQARVIGAGKYKDSKRARAACETDLQQLQRDAATTTKG